MVTFETAMILSALGGVIGLVCGVLISRAFWHRYPIEPRSDYRRYD